MECRKAKLKIILLSEGRLDPQDVVDLNRHLLVCPSCREEARTDALTCAAFGLLRRLEPREGGWERLQARLQSEEQIKRRFVWRPAVASAATVLAAAAIFVHLTGEPREEPRKAADAPPAAMRRLPPPETTADKTAEPRSKPMLRKPAEKTLVQKRQRVGTNFHKEIPPKVRRHEQIVENVHRHPVKVRHRKLASEPAAKPVDDPAAVEPETVGQGAQEAKPAAEFSSVATYEVSSEMSDLVSEGMSALVEAGKGMTHSGKEKQL